MAKASAGVKKQNRIDLSNLSQREKDILTMETKEAMQKYNLGKQGVYDRKFALNKKIKAAGLTIEQVMKSSPDSKPAPKKVQAKKVLAKKVRAKKVAAKTAEPEKPAPSAEEKLSENRDLMVISKQVPVIMKPIEINFDNFSIKLNGVPKKISINPDTNAIEIDL